MNARHDRPYVVHAFDVSYFSAKVRPALRYKRLWYDEVHADDGLIRKRTGLTFIPILITPEDESVAGTGWEAVLAHRPRHRVAKRGFDLVLATD